MSRTDKDRPWWVVKLQEKHIIDHDHRQGRCIEETRDRVMRGYRTFNHGHRRHCNKYIEVVEYCTKKDPHFDRYWDRQTCWTWVCGCPIPDSWKREWHGSCDHVRVQCNGHTRRDYDARVPCSCDDRNDEWPTCTFEPVEHRDFRSWYAGGIPSWFVREVYHRPERVRERGLRDLAREYNAYGDLEDGDFENRQARNSARWDWW